MVKQHGLAELRLGTSGVALFGALRTAELPTFTVDLVTLPANPAMVRSNSASELLFYLEGTLYTSAVRVRSLEGTRMELVLAQKPSPMGRRGTSRAKCKVLVQFRTLRPDGHAGAWQECFTDDMGAGGAGLVVDAKAEIPRRIEMRFFLPAAQATAHDDPRLAQADQALGEASPVRAIGKVTHCRRHSNDRVRYGTMFNVISAEDRERIARFVENTELAK
jgi:hypothetical protein